MRDTSQIWFVFSRQRSRFTGIGRRLRFMARRFIAARLADRGENVLKYHPLELLRTRKFRPRNEAVHVWLANDFHLLRAATGRGHHFSDPLAVRRNGVRRAHVAERPSNVASHKPRLAPILVGDHAHVFAFEVERRDSRRFRGWRRVARRLVLILLFRLDDLKLAAMQLQSSCLKTRILATCRRASKPLLWRAPRIGRWLRGMAAQ
jgi:hypothetical protein